MIRRELRVRPLYWLDLRDPLHAVWHGRKGDPRPHDAVDGILPGPPAVTPHDGACTVAAVEPGEDSYEAARGQVLVIGIPVYAS